MKQACKYIACILFTLLLSVGVSWLAFQRQMPKYYGVEKVKLTCVTVQDGTRGKIVTRPEDVAEIVGEMRRMVVQSIEDPTSNIRIGVPGYGIELYMTDGTTYSCSHVPGNDGSGAYYDSEGREMTVQLGSAKLWRAMDYEEILRAEDASAG